MQHVHLAGFAMDANRPVPEFHEGEASGLDDGAAGLQVDVDLRVCHGLIVPIAFGAATEESSLWSEHERARIDGGTKRQKKLDNVENWPSISPVLAIISAILRRKSENDYYHVH